jgi:predicted ATPase
MINEISVTNYKSLKDVTVSLRPVSFFCGPNASGKTNLAEALDFLSEVFRNGLQYAVAEKGGFYNICFRRQRRTKGAIGFRIVGETKIQRDSILRYEVRFTFRAQTQAIRSRFIVEEEEYAFRISSFEPTEGTLEVRIFRQGKAYFAEARETTDKQFERWFDVGSFASFKEIVAQVFKPRPQQLLLGPGQTFGFGFLGVVRRVGLELEGFRVFQINPRTARQAGAPSVTKGLGRHGENVPVVVDSFLSRKRLTKRLISWMRDVVPDLADLLPRYTETKQTGLFLQEKGFGLPWYAEDLSDGTIMALGLFICLLEPTHRTVLIEEPENGLHPWILKRFLDRCREVSGGKQILITTHSPLVVSAAQPEELFLIERRNGQTEIIPAINREPELRNIIRTDLLDLGDYWMSGGLGAVPAPPVIEEPELPQQPSKIDKKPL